MLEKFNVPLTHDRSFISEVNLGTQSIALVAYWQRKHKACCQKTKETHKTCHVLSDTKATAKHCAVKSQTIDTHRLTYLLTCAGPTRAEMMCELVLTVYIISSCLYDTHVVIIYFFLRNIRAKRRLQFAIIIIIIIIIIMKSHLREAVIRKAPVATMSIKQ